MNDYQRLEADAERPPKRVVDHRETWDKLPTLLTVNGTVRDRVEAFTQAKRISLEALIALGTRIHVDRNGGVELAWGHPAQLDGREIISALKFRPLGDKQRYAATPSTFVDPLIVGNRRSLDWFVAEGETDTARLYDLVGDAAAVLLLPAGARTFKQRWADVIPRGATVHLCHDADEDGDAGAAKAARILGTGTVRVRPPEGLDWCEWPGTCDEFIQLVQAARQDDDRPFALRLDEFVADKTETPPALVGDETENLLPAFGLLILFAKGGKGKTTLTVDAALHFASGVDWIGFTVNRPLRVLLIENEGPREPFRAKLELKHRLWEHELRGELFVHTFNWGALTLADSNHADRLRNFIAENAVDLVIGDPLDSLGIEGVGSPEDTRAFMDRLGHIGLFRDVAFWLLHHARKEGAQDELDEVSGAWGGKPDTMLMLEKRDGNRARLSFPKIRWSRRGTRAAYILAFDTDTETFTVAHEEEDEERDYITEIEQLLTDGTWRTPKEIAAPKDDGIGANVDTVKKILENSPDRFASSNGKDVGRSPRATVWQLTRASESVESVADSPTGKGRTDSLTSPIREVSK